MIFTSFCSFEVLVVPNVFLSFRDFVLLSAVVEAAITDKATVP
jgi:hypothetical protein